MINLDFKNKKFKVISIGTLLCSFLFSGSVFASQKLEANFSEEFEEWNSLKPQEKEEMLLPQTNFSEIPEEILNNYYLDYIPDIRKSLIDGGNKNLEVNAVSDFSLPSKYSLLDRMNIRVENQGKTSECWAFSTIKSMETNKALKNGTRYLDNFSERHMDYSNSKTFKDGINKKGLNREVGQGGLPISALAYLTNGEGAVKEEDMPFENNEQKISLSEINKPVDTIVTDYTIFPTIYKEYEHDSLGNTLSIIYKDEKGNILSEETVQKIRNLVKKHIIENGAVTTMTAAGKAKYYENGTIWNSKNYNCNNNAIRDHAVAIVGWDDNYSRNNFIEGHRPSKDGAYIVLNSYGEDRFDNGYLYISYEDLIIENEMYGISNTSKVDYDDIYQYDFFGGVYSLGVKDSKKGSIGNIYKRDISKNEELTSVGVSLAQYSNIEIYINPNEGNLDDTKLIKVASPQNVFSPGYHRVDIEPTKLNGEEFTIVVKISTVDENGFYFQVEANIPSSPYDIVDSENESYVSLDGNSWFNLKELKVRGIDLNKADVCIKGFTNDLNKELIDPEPEHPVDPEPEQPVDPEPEQPVDPEPEYPIDPEPEQPVEPDPEQPVEPDPEQPVDPEPEQPVDPEPEKPVNPEPEKPVDPDPVKPIDPEPDKPDIEDEEIESKVYEIDDRYITRINHLTKVSDFLENINTNLNVKILKPNGLIVGKKEIITTGMKARFSDGRELTLIVRGDINPDGVVDITDLSKIILHYNENKGFQLKGNALKSADMNYDGVVDLIDVSKLLLFYNSL